MFVKKVTINDIDTTYCCMNENPPGVSWADALPESRTWFKTNLGTHVEGYHLITDDQVVGHIYYAPAETALLPYEIESHVACIYCTEMLPEFMNHGYGTMMFDYLKTDLKQQRFKGIFVPATEFKEYMHYEHFLKLGFQILKEHGSFKLMYLPLSQNHIDVTALDLNYSPSREQVEVTLFPHFFCPVGAYMYHLIKNVTQRFGNQVKLVELNATLENIRKYGTIDPLINGKIKILGPASEEAVMKAIQDEIDHFDPSRP